MVRVVKKPEERCNEIIGAAGHLFLTKGYDSTTMKDVMNHLQIAKGTIYHYFSSKEVLLEAVLLGVADAETQRLKDTLENTEGNALVRLKKLITAGTSIHDDGAQRDVIDHLHKASNAGMHIRLLAMLTTLLAPLYAELFQQGCEEGIFTVEHPLECAEFLLSGIQFLTDMSIYTWTPEQLERRWQAFPALIEQQLNAPEGSFSFLLELNL